MHRRRAIQAVRSRCIQSRNAATAARLKPATWEDNSSPSAQPTPSLGKWAPISLNPGLGSTGNHPSLSKWARPPAAEPSHRPPSSQIPPHTRTPTSSNAHRRNNGQWTRNNPLSSRNDSDVIENRSTTNANLQSRHNAARKATSLSREPSSVSLSKWATSQPLRRSDSSRFPSLPSAPSQSASRPTQHDQRSPQSRFDSRPRPAEFTRQPDNRTSNRPSSTSSASDASTSRHDKLESLVTLPHVNQSSSLEDASSSKHSRATRKDRTSILTRGDKDFAIPAHSRVSTKHADQGAKLKRKKPSAPREKQISADVYIPSTVSVGTLSRLLGVKLEALQRKMRRAGMGDESSYDHVLTSDYAVLLAEEFGRNPIVNDEAAFDIFPSPAPADPSTLPSRPPVVTIMGHVDHGKTTLLDTLRSASVAKGEAGGITQHIGAFSVPVSNAGGAGAPQSITFLDTPGHAAFSAMRARGAQVTDIVVLVVAADDGIMPQTKEVINLIKQDEGKVGVVVAINKVDKPDVDVDAVQRALLVEGVQLEEFGGDIPSVQVSGMTGQGLPDLVETLSAMAEMQDLRAEHDGSVHGYVLESRVQKGLGPVATVLVLRGCLKPGSHIISGVHHAKVRVMNDPSGKPVKTAYPGTAVIVSGWKTLPDAGDEVLQGSESDVKKAVANRQRQREAESSLVDLEAINASRKLERERREQEMTSSENTVVTPQAETEDVEGPKILRIIVKGDVSGSVEAVVGAVEGIGNHLASVKVVSSGVGEVTESDVVMAKAVDGLIVGFSVATPRQIESLAAQNQVPIVSSGIIYRLMDEIKNRVVALLPPILETKVTGEATVLQLFDIHLKAKVIKKVAGCRVVNGLIEKSKNARVIRDGVTIHDGSLDTMRYLKKDVTEVRKGSECGISFGGFSDLREGDLIQMYDVIEKPATL